MKSLPSSWYDVIIIIRSCQNDILFDQRGIVSNTPDFENRYRRTVLRLGEPDRIPLADVSIDITHKLKFLGRPLLTPEDELEFWARAGFDYVVAEAGIQTTSAIAGTKTKLAAQYAMFDYGETERAWVEQSKSLIRSESDLKNFPWPDPHALDYSKLAIYNDLVPPGMKIVAVLGKIFNSVWWFMGFQHFAESLIENPGLVARLFEKIATIQLQVLDRMLEFDNVGAVMHSDDVGYSEALMISPAHLRQYLFPWFKELCDRIHAKGKLAIFHSDGKLDQVMPDLIECGFDAVHPFEPKAMDIVANKRMYGDKICVMGNIDLSYTLTRGTPDEVAAECRQRIRELGPGGGYCLGSANSIPEYVPHENFLTMLETVFEYGRYPLPDVTDTAAAAVAPEIRTGGATIASAFQVGDTPLDELMQVVVSGQPEKAEEATQRAIAAGISPQEIFNLALIPAMVEVGRRMEASEFFLPEVLLAAKAMQVASTVLEPLLASVAEVQQVGTVVLGTVQGDLHDIGKNLVGMLLKGNGFRVVDLGVDVSPEKFVKAARDHQADVVALSALLTTTMLNMKRVIEALTEAGLRNQVKVIVGGAPVQASFANEIGADGFALNAAAGVSLARRLMAGQG